MSKIELGMQVEDKITGFAGTAVGIVNYMSGCNQALVVPKVDSQGKLQDGQWFDVQRLTQKGTYIVSLDNGATPGGDALPSRNY